MPNGPRGETASTMPGRETAAVGHHDPHDLRALDGLVLADRIAGVRRRLARALRLLNACAARPDADPQQLAHYLALARDLRDLAGRVSALSEDRAGGVCRNGAGAP